MKGKGAPSCTQQDDSPYFQIKPVGLQKTQQINESSNPVSTIRWRLAKCRWLFLREKAQTERNDSQLCTPEQLTPDIWQTKVHRCFLIPNELCAEGNQHLPAGESPFNAPKAKWSWQLLGTHRGECELGLVCHGQKKLTKLLPVQSAKHFKRSKLKTSVWSQERFID